MSKAPLSGTRPVRPTSVRRIGAAVLTLLLGATAALGAGLAPVHPGAKGSYSAVLMWHDVVAKKKEVWFDTTVAEIEAQFRDIKKNGLTPVPLEVLGEHLESGKAIPPGAVVLTFDDNNEGLYRHLFPILKRYRWPAVFFVHTDYVGKPTSKAHCTWEQLREMEQSGLVKAYPHTASHPADLRDLSDKQLVRELVTARQVMEKQLGGSRAYFAYSNGFYDERVAQAAAKAGYRLSITEDWGAAEHSRNLMMVRRYSMHKRAAQAVQDVARAMRRGKKN
jgi:peptidoglycan/xylan/chitin deacetylase (PgdA/CDA1 family)